jgi:integral membrane sensor domain MASE1
MKEEWEAILAGLGAIMGITLATVVLKRFFENIPTSGVLSCILIVFGILCITALLIMDYIEYKVREKTKRK